MIELCEQARAQLAHLRPFEDILRQCGGNTHPRNKKEICRMDPNQTKIVTNETVTSEDLKPEGRTDGPKNFGPEFTQGPGGKLVPTRPAEHIERVARSVADAARAEGQDEAAVVRAFAGVMPEEHMAAIPESAQPVPDVVPGSMSHADRAAHNEKHAKKSRKPHEQLQYDIGVGLAQENKALPLEASHALKEGYEETRKGMAKQLEERRKKENTTVEAPASDSPSGKGGTTSDELNATSQHPGTVTVARAAEIEFEAGANIAKAGGKLPDAATESAKKGFASVSATSSPKSEKEQAEYDAGYGYAQADKPLPEDASEAMKAGFADGKGRPADRGKSEKV